MDGSTETDRPQGRGGGIANLRPPSTTDEAREWGRRGGIASGEARRKRASLREELIALLSADDGVVAKSIAVAICREAKDGNVGAFKAIAQVLGELKEVIGVEAETLPPPIVLAVHDAAFIDAERERQRREFAEIVDVAVADLGAEAKATPAPSPAESTETGIRPAGNAPQGADGKTPAETADAPVGRFCASPAPRVPRTPSEAAAMRREREARERRAQGGDGSANAAPPPRQAVPAAIPKQRGRRVYPLGE